MEDAPHSVENQEIYPPSLNTIRTIFEEFNVPEVSDEICTRVLDVLYRHTFDVIEESKAISVHSGHKSIEESDMQLAIESVSDGLMFAPPHKEQLLTYAEQRNSQPLPPIRPHCGLRLPNERYNLTAPNYVMASEKDLCESKDNASENTYSNVPGGQPQSHPQSLLRLSTSAPAVPPTRPGSVSLPLGSSTVHVLAPPGINASMIRIQSVQSREASGPLRTLPITPVNPSSLQRRFINGQP